MTVEKGPSAGRGAWVANPRDFYGALALLLLALCVLWGTRDLPGWYGFQLGAGSVPRLFAALLAANALIVMAISAFTRGPAVNYSLPAAIAIALLAAVGVAADHFGGPVIAIMVLIVAAFASLKLLNQFEIRGPIFIALGVLAFGVFIKPLGLAIAVFTLVIVSAAASREFRPVESLIWAVCLSAFTALLFIFVLNLPIPVLPAFLLSQ
jgi:putative tricarboxylic transport membrane protein